MRMVLKSKNTFFISICLVAFILLLLVPDVALGSPLDKVDTDRVDRPGEEGLNEQGIKSAFHTLAVVMQAIGVDLTVVFMILGCMIMVLATGLNHPEYMKWGRATLIMTVIMFGVIKLGPIILYSI